MVACQPVSTNSTVRNAPLSPLSANADSAREILEDAAAVQEDSSRVVDTAALLNRCLGNTRLVERVLTKFRETGGADIHQLQLALESSDLERVVEIAHRFKGASGNIAATHLHELSARAERLGRETNGTELWDVLQRLHSEWLNFVHYSETFLAANGSTNYSRGATIR